MTTTAPNAITITDTRFAALKAKLRELFELDKADLDFGIYRIMAARNKEVTDFLDRQLKDVVRETLIAHGAGAADQIEKQIVEARKAADAAGFDPDESPKVKELQAKLDSAGGASAAELEADIYNHLLAFFSRYYDEGDFISKRRYKGDTYAIPYSGEEVTLHWANKDQYYIKSGEWHKDYRFTVNGKSVRFKLVEATQETNNNKEADDAKRRFILDADHPVEVIEGELTLRFHFRVPTDEDKQQAADGAVAVFGGDYAKPKNPKKGDEREQFCADAEQHALAGMSPEVAAAWKLLVTQPAPTETKPARTILGKHLDEFSARNTFDYFIHKDLGGFLRRELDFYIKNEVVRLDDLEHLPADQLQRVQGKVKAIRGVAGRIIEFLAGIENFQKKMWLKKKLVLETNWLVTIDRIPAALRDTVADNDEQWREWEMLGFKPEGPTDKSRKALFTRAIWGTRKCLDDNDKLVVDTRFFAAEFKSALLASEEVLAGATSVDEAHVGTLVQSENFQAIEALRARYREGAHCVYLDPPYNTTEETFKYKNLYRHSSWAAMIYSRLLHTVPLMAESACVQLAIDDAEYHRAKSIMDITFGEDNYVGTIAVQTNPRGRGINSHYATSHDYIICSARNERAVRIVDQPLTEDQEAGYSGSDDASSYRLLPFRRSGGLSTPEERPNSEFVIFVDRRTDSVVGVGGPRTTPFPSPYAASDACVLIGGEAQWLAYTNVAQREEILEVWPVDASGGRRVWRWSDRDKIMRHIQAGDFVAKKNGDTYSIQLKDRIKAGRKPKTLWYDSKYDGSSHGTNLIADIIGDRGLFGYPKSIYNTRDALHSIVGDNADAVVLDYFAGSGTTGHAVIDLNRDEEEGGNRKFILVEMGAYFHTVLKPRIAKVLYSPDWKDGNAQTHGKGMSALVKYFALESYDDALNNLPAPKGGLLAGADAATRDAMITYALDLDHGPNLLNLDVFRDPWGYSIEAQPAGESEIRPHRVDLVETFNYLLGLKVRAYGPVQRFSADFERAEHADDLGRLKLSGRLRLDKNGPYVFQRVEGELNDGADTRVLVVWRKLTDDPEKDAAVVEAWWNRYEEDTRKRSEYRENKLVYINGPVTLPQPTQEIRTVFPIEQTFKDRMFADTDTTGGA